MNIRTTTFDHLTSDEIGAWSAIQRAHPAFSNPYFRPEFAQLVASVRSDVEVAVLEKAGAPVGFFPFQRSFFNAGRPVGSGLNDFQGLIAPPDLEFDPHELLRACRLSSWRFDHLMPVHTAFKGCTWSSADSPYIDLPDGIDGYLQGRENGSSIMAEYRRKKRRIEREVGPLRHEPHVSDPAVLATCIQWKTEQLRQMGVPSIFDHTWVTRLLHSILAYQTSEFSGAMPVCYAGKEIAAINFGMRCGDVFHSWFPTYNPQLAGCSPGYLHFIEMMMAAESLGIRRIILGIGDESYKKRLMNGVDRLAQGSVDCYPAMGAARRAWRHTRQTIKASPLGAPARVPARFVTRVTRWLALR